MAKPKFNPDAAFEIVDKPKFDPNAAFEEVTEEKVSGLEAGVRSFIQGGTLGFGDELVGAGEVVGRLVGLQNTSKSFGDITVAAPDWDLESLSKAYQEARDFDRQRNEKQMSDQTGVSLAAGLAGSIMSPANRLLKGANLASRVASAAGVGAASGVGLSDEDNIQGLAQDAAIGGALGGAFQGIGEKVISPLAGKLGTAVSKVGSKITDKIDDSILPGIGKVTAGVDDEVTKRYLQRSAEINASESLEDIGQYAIKDVREQFAQAISQADDIAWRTLRNEPAIPKAEIAGSVDDLVSSILKGKEGNLTRTMAVGADAEKLSALQKLSQGIKEGFGDKLSESDLKALVKEIQEQAYSFEGSPKTTNQAKSLRQIAGILNDKLKSGNADYRKAMVPVAEMTDKLQSFERSFINRAAGDSPEKFIQAAKKLPKKAATSEAVGSIRAVDKVTGAGVEDMVKDRLAFEAFEKADTNGSRKTILGAVVGNTLGTALGVPIGLETVGAILGFSGDKLSGQILKGLLDGRIKAPQATQALSKSLGRFTAPLVDAASRGNKALAQTHFILQQRYPEYAEKLKQMKDQEDERN